MMFERWWREGYRSSDELECEWIAREAWDAARPKPPTDDEIRECWRACSGSAPMAFAREIQKKLGVIDDTR